MTTHDAFVEDRMMRQAVIRGSAALADALEGGHGPDRLVWHENTGMAKGAYGVSHRYPEALARMEQREAFTDSLRVRRDPCFRCGTRSDVGCRHV